MANVVVAILLEKYLGATAEAEDAKNKEKQRARRAETSSKKSDSSTNVRDRKLEKDDLIEMIVQVRAACGALGGMV